MNVSLSWQTSILCISIIDTKMVANNYTFVIDFITNTENTKQQNIAFERMKFMFDKIFNQSTFISEKSILLPQIIELAPNNIVLLPEEAYDQIVNLAMFCKLNSVMEDILHIESISISSSLNDDITYSYSEGDPLGPYMVSARKKDKPWWVRPDLCTVSNPGNTYPIPQWSEIGLGLEPLKKPRKGKHTVDTAPQIPYTKPTTSGKVFTPEIILGGKHNDAD
jgi:hypothetical protein